MTEVPQSCQYLSCCAACPLLSSVGYRFLCRDEPDGMHTSERSELDIRLSHTKCLVKYFSTIFKSFSLTTFSKEHNFPFLLYRSTSYIERQGMRIKMVKVFRWKKTLKNCNFIIINLVVKRMIVKFNIKLLLLCKKFPFTLFFHTHT